MLEAIQLKGLELVNRMIDAARTERGQTTAEYVAVTAVGVALATVILWGTLKDAIQGLLDDITTQLSGFDPFS